MMWVSDTGLGRKAEEAGAEIWDKNVQEKLAGSAGSWEKLSGFIFPLLPHGAEPPDP